MCIVCDSRNYVPLLSRAGYGDADYLRIFDELLLPIARDFKPQLIFISAGFDCAAGDPLGGMVRTAYC